MWGHGVLGMEDKRRPEAACICDGMILSGRIFDGGVTNNRLHSYTVTQDTIWGVLWVFPGTDALPDGSSHL